MDLRDLRYDDILKTEFCEEYASAAIARSSIPAKKIEQFLTLCRDAMVMSCHKYGFVRDGYGPGKDKNAMDSIEPRLERYEKGGWRGDVEIKPGNTEWMTDVFNFAMIEYMAPRSKLRWDLKLLVENIQSSDERIQLIRRLVMEYAKTHSAMDLVLIGELALYEFCDPRHKKAHFKGTDNQSPGRVADDGFSGEQLLSEHPNEVYY